MGEWKSKQFHGQLVWVISVGTNGKAPSLGVWVWGDYGRIVTKSVGSVEEVFRLQALDQ